MARLERSSISLRPRRSATRPHTGEAKAATNEVTPLRMPAHRSTALAVSTRARAGSSGMIGLSTENAPVMMNWMPTMTQSVRCHCSAATSFASAAADFRIAPPAPRASLCRSNFRF